MACKAKEQNCGLPCNGVMDPDFGHFIMDHSDKRKITKSVKYPLDKSREMLTPGLIYPKIMMVGPDSIHTYDLHTLKWSSKSREEINRARVLAACPAMEGKLLLKLCAPYHGQTICFFSLETSTVQTIPPCLNIDPPDLHCMGYCNGVVVAIGGERHVPGSSIVEYYMNKQWNFLYRFNNNVETTVYTDVMANYRGSLYAACADDQKHGYVLRVKCDCEPKDDNSIPVEWSLLSLPETNLTLAQDKLPDYPTAIVACQGGLYSIQANGDVLYLYKVFVEGPWREEKQRISAVYDPEAGSTMPALKGFRRAIGLGDMILFQLANGEMWMYCTPSEPWPPVQTFLEVKSLANSTQWGFCAWNPPM